MQSGANIYDGYINDSDFIGTSFPTAPDGKLYQLLVQQFANLYWFRQDWFTDPKNVA